MQSPEPSGHSYVRATARARPGERHSLDVLAAMRDPLGALWRKESPEIFHKQLIDRGGLSARGIYVAHVLVARAHDGAEREQTIQLSKVMAA